MPHREKWVTIRNDNGRRHEYKKLHIICGVLTNIIASAKVTKGTQHDSPMFEGLMKDTSSYFKIKEIYADAGYLSKRNCDISEEVGAIPYILPKKNVNKLSRGSYAWRKMLLMWHEKRDVFKEHYHRRSNVESTFSAMKRKFLPYVRSKNSKAQENEILCKIVCHNISVLINSMFELGVELKY